MLTAAAKAAGAVWNNVKDDVTSFAQKLIEDSARVAADYAAKKISDDDLKTDLQMLGDFAAIVKNYDTDAIKEAAQAAFNAAIDALWSAIKAGTKIL
jgi:hypothetical protein